MVVFEKFVYFAISSKVIFFFSLIISPLKYSAAAQAGLLFHEIQALPGAVPVFSLRNSIAENYESNKK